MLGLTILCVSNLALAGPLQPSSKQVRSVLKTVLADSRCPDKAVVVSVGPAELTKNWEENPTDVMVEVVIRDPLARRLYEITANAKTNKVTEWQRVDDQEPIIHPNDIDSVYKIVTNHKPWLASLERRGLSVDDVFLDAWPSGIPRNAFRFRNVRVVTYLKQSDSKPRFAQPIEGLAATVNLDARRVFEFFDRDVAPIPESTIDPGKEYRNTKRKRLAPYKVQQNARNAIKISNGVVDWNGWKFIPLVHAKDGLVLHNVSHTANNTTRTIAARLSVSELISTTTSTSQYWFFRQPMYVGEYGLGANVVEQKIGVDLPTNIRTIASARLMSDTKIDDIPSAIALYEIDADPVWTFTNDGPQGRMGRSLVVQTRSFVAQRDVIQRYVISVDGSITIDVGVGGSPMIEAVTDSVNYEDSEGNLVNGVLVAPHAKVPYQSLVASFRLDLDLDGVTNTVSEV